MRSDLIISFEVRGRRERKTRGGRRDETVETKTRRGGFWTIRAGRTIVWVYGVGVARSRGMVGSVHGSQINREKTGTREKTVERGKRLFYTDKLVQLISSG